MGIAVAELEFLIRIKDHIRGDALQLGRQGMHIVFRQDIFNAAYETFKRYFPDGNIDDILATRPHADALFTYLGASTVESLDYSPFEEATIIHDLNNPVPPELQNRFDFIYDGGTIEHVYDIKTTMENIKKMLRVGGIFAGLSVADGCLGHGFYQFSPELYRTVFSEENGYKILSYELVDITDLGARFVPLETPPKGQRQEFRLQSAVSVNNGFVIQKVRDIDVTPEYQQSDYVANWDHYNGRVNQNPNVLVYRT
jgi:hypothetical protein